jgi:uncharacterized integral membrane protein
MEVSGSNSEDVEKVIQSVTKDLNNSGENNIAKLSIIKCIASWTFCIGALFAILGIVLVILGATGETEFSFFGQTFKSTNIGIAAFFLGAAIIVLNVRRVLKSLDK